MKVQHAGDVTEVKNYVCSTAQASARLEELHRQISHMAHELATIRQPELAYELACVSASMRSIVEKAKQAAERGQEDAQSQR